MNKFIKVSIGIIAVSLIFIFGNKLIYKDMVHEEDYNEINKKEIRLKFDNKKDTEKGTIVTIKVKNDSKYIYRLYDAQMQFKSIIMDKNGEEEFTTSLLNLDLYYEFEESLNDKIRSEGIQPYDEGYIQFLVPKGLSLDKNYFNLPETEINCEGAYTLNLPFSKDAYRTYESGSATYTIE